MSLGYGIFGVLVEPTSKDVRSEYLILERINRKEKVGG